MGRPPFRGAAAVLAAALIVAACGDDDTTVDATPTTAPAAEEQTEPETTSTTSTTVVEAEETVVEVAVSGGEVRGGGRTTVPLGETVTVRVTSDVDDHIHLHGYDVLADVRAGETAELVFTADIPGVFEVELEDAGIALLELEIS